MSQTPRTDAVRDGAGGPDLQIKYAKIEAATSGDNSIVAAVAGKKIRVLELFNWADGTVNLYYTSGASGTVIWGGSTTKINLTQQTGYTLPASQFGWFETGVGAALIMNCSSTAGISGGLAYVLV